MHLEIINIMNTASLSHEHLSIGLKTFSFEIYRGHLRFFILRTISTCRFGSSMNTIFWTLFGQIDESSFKINESGYGATWKTGMTLFGAFNIVAVLVALNMLIAILNQRYTSVTVSIEISSLLEVAQGQITWENSRYFAKPQLVSRVEEQGWSSGESTRLPPMWPGFKSRRRSHTWDEFVVGSLHCSKKFLSGYSGFPLSSKPALPNSNSIWNALTHLNEFIWTPKCSVGKQITIYNFTNVVWEKENALYLSVNILSTKVLIGDTLFTSATGDGSALLCRQGKSFFKTLSIDRPRNRTGDLPLYS